MFNFFFWLTLVLAAADWAAIIYHWEQAHWVTKPGTLVALIAWFSLAGHWSGPLAFIGLGLVFSLLGDVLLLLPERFFTSGMAAFLVAQISYIIGLNIHQPLVFRWEALIPILVVGIAFLYLLKRVRCGMGQPEPKALVPFAAYGIALSLMWLSALLTLLRPAWMLQPAILVSLGGSAFFLSDSVLACCRFNSNRRNSDLVVMVTYHLAQILIAFGTLNLFLII